MISTLERMRMESAIRESPASSQDPFVSSLVQLGLSRTEARAYLAALRLHRVSARTIARDCSIDVPAAYRAIDDLVAKGLLSLELGVPNIYVAVSLPRCVKQLLSQLKQEVDSKTRIADDLVLEYSSLNGTGDTQEASAQPGCALSYKLFTSRKTADRDFFNRITQANMEVLIVHPAIDNAYLANHCLEMFRDLSRKGVVLRAITESDNSSFGAVKALSRYWEVRSHRRLSMRFSITDRKKVSFGIADFATRTEQDYEPYLVITDPGIADSMAVFFQSLWKTSTPIGPTRAQANRPQGHPHR